MKMLFILIILAVILLCAAIVVFFGLSKQRQFDDLDVHAYSILKEDDLEVLDSNGNVDNSTGDSSGVLK